MGLQTISIVINGEQQWNHYTLRSAENISWMRIVCKRQLRMGTLTSDSPIEIVARTKIEINNTVVGDIVDCFSATSNIRLDVFQFGCK